MTYRDSTDRLRGKFELLGKLQATDAAGAETADFVILSLRSVKLDVNVPKAFIGRLLFGDKKWIDKSNHSLAFGHIPHSPNPDVAIVHSFEVHRPSLAPYDADADSRIDHVNHSSISVPNGTTNRLDVSAPRKPTGNPQRPFSVDNPGEPAHPLLMRHFREWMNRAKQFLNSFHNQKYTTDAHRLHTIILYFIGWACAHGAAFARALAIVDPEAVTVIDLFCGGGLGACGWHQRYWSYQPLAVELT